MLGESSLRGREDRVNVIARRALPDVAISRQARGDPHVASLLGMTVNASPMNPVRPLRPLVTWVFSVTLPQKTNKGLPSRTTPVATPYYIYESEYVFLMLLSFCARPKPSALQIIDYCRLLCYIRISSLSSLISILCNEVLNTTISVEHTTCYIDFSTSGVELKDSIN